MPIIVVTPPSSTMLTTLATVKARLGISGTGDDSLLTTLITAASASASAYLGRTLARQTVRETVKSTGRAMLKLSITPVATIEAIELVDSGVAVDATEYVVENPGAGLIRRKSGFWEHTNTEYHGLLRRPTFGSEYAGYEVEYTGGYILPSMAGTRDLPEPIEEAVIEMVSARYKARLRDPMIASETLNEVGSVTYISGAAETSSAITLMAKAMLDPYRRVLL